MGTSRLPNKALLKLNGKPAILRMTDRIKESKTIKEIWLATGKAKINKERRWIKGKISRSDDLIAECSPVQCSAVSVSVTCDECDM